MIIRELSAQFLSTGLLVLPIPVALLSIVLAGLQARTNQASFYVHTTIRSRLERLTGSQVLGWAHYLSKPPAEARFALGIFPVIAYYFPIWTLFFLVEVSPIVLFFMFFPGLGIFHLVLLIADVSLIVISVLSFYLVRVQEIMF